MPGTSDLWVIFAEEFRRQIRNRGFVFFTVALSVLMLAMIPLTPVIVGLLEDDPESAAEESAPAGEAPSPLERVGYVDPSGVLPAPGSRQTPRPFADAAAGLEAVRNGEIDTLFALDANYLESGQVKEYWTLRETRGRFGGNWDAQGAFRAFLRQELIGGRVPDNVLARAVDPGYYAHYDVAADGAVTQSDSLAQSLGEFFVAMMFAALLLIAVVTGSGGLLRAVSEEKETRMMEMLVTSASPLSIMAGKLLAAGSVGLIHIAVWLIVAFTAVPAIFDSVPGGAGLSFTPGLLAVVSLCFLLGYFLFSVLSLLIATVVSSAAEGQRQTGMLILPGGLPLWLSGLIVNSPDNLLAQILSWFPFTAPTMLMVRIGGGSQMSAGEVAGSLAVVAATALVLLWAAARIFRAGILLSGQRITPANVWTALRHAE